MEKNNRSLLIFSVIIFIFLLFSVRFVQKFRNATLVDFPSYYYGVKITFQQGMTPYTRSHWNHAIMLFGKDQDLYPYVYLPPSLLFFYPLLYFDYQTIQLLLIIGNLLSLPIFLWLFFYQILRLPYDSFLPLVGAAFIILSRPIYVALKAGQIDLFVLLLICIVWWATKYEKHPIFIIGPLVIAIIIKLYPVILLFFFFFQKKYKIIIWVIALIILISLISFEVLPENTWNHWYEWVGSRGYGELISTRLGPSSFGNQNINAFFSRLFLGRGKVMESPIANWFNWTEEVRETINHWVIWSTVVIVSTITLIPASLYILVEKNKSINLIFSLTLLLMLLIAPISNINHLIYSIPAAFSLINLFWNEAKKTKLIITIVATIALVIPFNLSALNLQEGYKVFFLSPYFYSILALWLVSSVYLIIELRKYDFNNVIRGFLPEWSKIRI